MSHYPYESVPSTSETLIKRTKLQNDSDSLTVIKHAVVVLTRLPEYKISALRPPTPQQFYSEDDSLSSSDSDMQWEPGEGSSDSDFSLSNNKQKSGKTKNDTKAHAPQTSGRNNNNGNATNIFIFLKTPVIHILQSLKLKF